MKMLRAFWTKYIVRPRCDIKAHLGLEPHFTHYWTAYTHRGERCGRPAIACTDAQVVGRSYLCKAHAEDLQYQRVWRQDVVWPELVA